MIRWRWLRPLIAVPLVAGVLATALVLIVQERAYEASTTISIVDVTAEAADQFSVGPRIDDFVLALSSPGVAEAVEEAIGEGGSIAERFTATRSGSGALVIVDFRASSEESAVLGLEVGVQSALVSLANADLERASVELEAAERQQQEARAALTAIEEETGATDLAFEYRERSADILRLRTTIASEPGDQEQEDRLSNLLEEKQTERDELGGALVQWQDAQQRLESASAALAIAERTVFRSETVITRAANYPVRPVTGVTSTSVVSAVALPVIAAMVVAGGFVLVIALLSERSRFPAAGDTEPEPVKPRPAKRRAPAKASR